MDATRALQTLTSNSSQSSWPEYVHASTKLKAEFDSLIEINLYCYHVHSQELVSDWLKSKFVHFALQDPYAKGISLRPSDSVKWSKTRKGDSNMFKG